MLCFSALGVHTCGRRARADGNCNELRSGIVKSLERRTIGKVTRRLLPLLMVSYFIAYLDRVNVAFAGPGMMRDLSFTYTVFGTGAGIFFIGYVLFEVPSNLVFVKLGARKWIARIMLTWGLISAATAFVWDDNSFYVIRVLLGIAEAGFFPGVIYYFALWYPAEHRARVISWFMFAIPVSIIIGAPISGFILGMGNVAGVAAWRWLFVLEAAPAVIMAFVVWRCLSDRPADAQWLAADERQWLAARLSTESHGRYPPHYRAALRALLDRRVLLLGLVYASILVPNYGIAFFLPQIIIQFGGLSSVEVGLINAIPYLAGAVAMVLWARHSDATRERKWHIALPAGLMAAGFIAAALVDTLDLKIVAISLAALGFSISPVFWTVPASILRGASAAAGIAAINSIGNLGGYFGPQIFGIIKDTTGTDSGGLLFLAGSGLFAFVLVLMLGRNRALEEGISRTYSGDRP